LLSHRVMRLWNSAILLALWALKHCRISPPHFLTKFRKRRLNQASSVLLCFVLFAFYPRDAMLARVIEIATCLSVCPSVTRRYCVKTKKASGMISSPSGSPKTLVFWRQISSPNSKGFPNRGPQTRVGRKNSAIFLASSVNISKTVADTAKVTISH